MSWIVRIFVWICLLFCYVKIKADFLMDEEFNAEVDLTVNPYLGALEPVICGFSPEPPFASECCITPPIFPQEDLNSCFNVTDLKEIDVDTLNTIRRFSLQHPDQTEKYSQNSVSLWQSNLQYPDRELKAQTTECTKLSCVFTLYKLVNDDGYFIYKRVVKYMDHWAQLYPGYEMVAVNMKAHCFYHQFSIYDVPCLLITVYACYLEKIKEICPVYRTEDECQVTAEYKRLCTQDRAANIPETIQ